MGKMRVDISFVMRDGPTERCSQWRLCLYPPSLEDTRAKEVMLSKWVQHNWHSVVHGF